MAQESNRTNTSISISEKDSKMGNQFQETISRMSTDELKVVYLDKFLDYQEPFVQECYHELISRRRVSKEWLQEMINSRKMQYDNDLVSAARLLHDEGKSVNDIQRIFDHYGISQDRSANAIDFISEEVKNSKWEKIENGILIGPLIVLIVFLLDYFGYVVVIRSIIPIPISYPLAFVGAVWFVMALIRKIYVAINE